jgi:hypothetical protein
LKDLIDTHRVSSIPKPTPPILDINPSPTSEQSSQQHILPHQLATSFTSLFLDSRNISKAKSQPTIMSTMIPAPSSSKPPISTTDLNTLLKAEKNITESFQNFELARRKFKEMRSKERGARAVVIDNLGIHMAVFTQVKF